MLFAKRKKVWISSIPDENIWHIWAFDIMANYGEYERVYIQESNIDKKSKPQMWRRFVMNKLYGESVSYCKFGFASAPRPKYSYDFWSFIKYDKDEKMGECASKVGSKLKGEYILLNQRPLNNRYLYETQSGLPLQEFLSKKKFDMPFRYYCFDEMSVDEQYEICSRAALFISTHGAGCTNLVFTPEGCGMMEISQRTHWHCDPVCEDHFFAKIPVEQKCSGKLRHRSEYHKADFHNLCHLIGKKYYELEPDRYLGFRNRNPISKKKIYVDGQRCIDAISFALVNT